MVRIVVVVVAHRQTAVERTVDNRVLDLLVELVLLVLAHDDSQTIHDCLQNADHCIVDRIDRHQIGPHRRHRSGCLRTLVELVRPIVHVVVLVGLLANDRRKLGNCKVEKQFIEK